MTAARPSIAIGIDTSGSTCATALWRTRPDGGPDADAGDVLASIREPMDRGHAEALLPMIETLISSAGIGVGDIDLIGVVHGPGAFTGLRIGMAAAAGLSLVTGAPMVGVSGFDAMAAGAVPGLRWSLHQSDAGNNAGSDADRGACLMVALESRRAEIFYRSYGLHQTAGSWTAGEASAMVCIAPEDVIVPDAGIIVVSGNAAERLCAAHPRRLRDSVRPPVAIDAGVVARLAWADRAAGSMTPPTPLYLRPPDAVAAPSARSAAP